VPIHHVQCSTSSEDSFLALIVDSKQSESSASELEVEGEQG